jgi:hypothetical protein
MGWATATPSAAQTWAKIYGGESSDWVDSAAAAPDGGAYVGGTTEGATGGSDDDIWVARVDSSGVIAWHRRLGSEQIEASVTLKAAADGGVFVLGQTRSGLALHDVVLAKMSQDGVLEWQVLLTGSTEQEPRAMLATTDGGAIAVIGTDFRATQVIMKLDVAGTLVWDRAVEAGPLFFTMSEHPDGGFVAAGRYFPVIGVNDRGWVARFDVTGNRLWERAIEFGTEHVEIRCVGSTADGGVVLAGYTGFPTEDAIHTVLTMRFDATGALARQQSYVWPERIRLSPMPGDVLPDGGLLVGGRGHNPTTRAEDGWYARILSDGTMAWQGTYFRGMGIGGDISGIAALTDGSWLAASSALPRPFGVADIALIRMDDTGYISYPCPEFQPGGMVPDPKTAVIVPVTTDDVVLPASVAPAALSFSTNTWDIIDHCCPHREPPAELSGPGSAQPLRVRRVGGMTWEDPVPYGACAANVYRGDLRDLRAGSYGACIRAYLEAPPWSDGLRPGPGVGWFYLVTAANLVTDGSMGTDSFGTPRVNSTPCP